MNKKITQKMLFFQKFVKGIFCPCPSTMKFYDHKKCQKIFISKNLYIFEDIQICRYLQNVYLPTVLQTDTFIPPKNKTVFLY